MDDAVEDGPEWMPSSTEEMSAICSLLGGEFEEDDELLWKRLSEKRRETDSTRELREEAEGRCKV